MKTFVWNILISFSCFISYIGGIDSFGEAVIGGPCSVPDDCVGNPGVTSECRNGRCFCKVGYISSSYLDDCFPLATEIGQSCQEYQQCQQGTPGELSDCIENQCSCIAEAIHDPLEDHICRPKKNLIGDECVVNAQCRANMGEQSYCNTDVCDCDSDLSVPRNDSTFCLPIVNKIRDEACEDIRQCTAGEIGEFGECTTDNVCDCRSDAIHEDGNHKCYLKAEQVGGDCQVDPQCTENLGDLSKCELTTNKCICPSETSVPSESQAKCLEIIDEVQGKECEETLQCTAGLPGGLSECVEEPSDPPSGVKKCNCTIEAVNSANRCYLKAVDVGGECEVHAQCEAGLGDLSRCEGEELKFCVCPTDTSVPSGENDECLGIVDEIGGNCNEDIQCTTGEPGSHSQCSGGICECKDDSVNEPGQDICYKKAEEVGGPCDLDVQCKSQLGESSLCLGNGTCACVEGKSVPSIDNERCLLIKNEIGETCEEPQQCTSGIPGEWSDCMETGVKESNKVCNCTAAAIQEGQICLRKAELVGEPCKIDKQCTASLGERSYCFIDEGDEDFEGKCICKPGNVESADRKRCVVSGIQIGRPCEDNAECVGEPGTSQCASNRCGCVPGYIPSSGFDDCLKVINAIGGECREIQQCQQGDLGPLSNCFSKSIGVGICNCTDDAITEPGEKQVCRKKAVHVGDSCLVQSQCYASLGYSQCFGGICTCLGNSTASSNNTACLLKSFLYEACEDPNQCNWVPQSPYSASCHLRNASDPDAGSMCQCNSNFISPVGRNDVCYPLAQSIGDACTNDDIQCNNIVNATCSIEKVCGCNNITHVPSVNRRVCLPRVEQLNSACNETRQCSPINSECLLNTTQNEMLCICRKDEYIESVNRPGNCLKIVNEIRLPCEEKLQCSAGLGPSADCIDNYCHCSSNHQYFEGGCYYPVELNGICRSDGECQVGVNNYTFCDPGRRCNCVQDAFPFENKCFITKYIGDACNSHIECTLSILGPVYCNPSTRKCDCQLGYSESFANSICSGTIPMLPSSTGVLVVIFIAGAMSKLSF